jgi:hypothetical protein
MLDFMCCTRYNFGLASCERQIISYLSSCRKQENTYLSKAQERAIVSRADSFMYWIDDWKCV